jgi:hypothetical protein
MTNWTREFPGAVTVCDSHGVITQINDKSAATLEIPESMPQFVRER